MISSNPTKPIEMIIPRDSQIDIRKYYFDINKLSFPNNSRFALIFLAMTEEFDDIMYYWCLLDRKSFKMIKIEPHSASTSFLISEKNRDCLISCSIENDKFRLGYYEILPDLTLSVRDSDLEKVIPIRNPDLLMSFPLSYGFVIFDCIDNLIFDFIYAERFMIVTFEEDSRTKTITQVKTKYYSNSSKINIQSIFLSKSQMIVPRSNQLGYYLQITSKKRTIEKQRVISIPKLYQNQIIYHRRLMIYFSHSKVLGVLNRHSGKKALSTTVNTKEDFNFF